MRISVAVIAALALASVCLPIHAASIFSDGFEGGVSGANWEAMPGSTFYTQLVGDSAHAFGAGSAKQVNADPAVYYSRTTAGAFTSPGGLTTGMTETLTAWMWEDNVQSGAQTAAGVMLANSGGTDFYQMSVNSTRQWGFYCWRTAAQGTFDSTIARSQGWHKFQIVVSPYTGSNDVSFYIDDVFVTSGNRKFNLALDQVRLGISIKTPGSPFWYDNVNLDVTTVPEPASLVGLGAGLLGLLGLCKRRLIG